MLVDLRDNPIDGVIPVPEALLSAQEIKRWESFRRPIDRVRYLQRTALLRTLLGQILDRDGASIRFRTNSLGKPALAGDASVQFNLSHALELVLLAFHCSHPVGVDVEQIDQRLQWRPIAERCLPERTLLELLERPVADQRGAFIQCWCDLEAQLKCRGHGLSGLNQCQPAASAGGERIWPVRVPLGFRAAVAEAKAPCQGLA